VAGRLLRASDFDAVREQLGREPTVPFEVVARCTGDHPLVIRNEPVDSNGAPFPTRYWLTCPEAVKAVSRLESEGWIARLNERAAGSEEFGDELRTAHRTYALERDGDAVARFAGVGGTRTGVKCLHAHYAYRLGGGDDPVGAWVAEQIEPVHADQRSGRVAVIDQGTNSIRLLVVEPGPGPGAEPTELARDMVITRLGRGVDRTGRLDEVALRRTIDVLARFCRRARALGAGQIRVGATAAVRDATNREGFAAAVRTHAGSELEVITGEKEAALAFLGGTRGLRSVDGAFLLIDIGGGSTEFVLGREPGFMEHAISTQMGSVRMTERFVKSDPPTQSELDAVRASANEVLADVEARMPVSEARLLIAVAGTATTTQACALGLEVHDPDLVHRSWLSLDDAERTLDRFSSMTNDEREAIPVMPAGRGDVITAGAAILTTLMQRLGFDRALVSETDILDGLALELMGVR
jgi:exopolyphosphatase/guanosine-5'-triphosphate,3'-diphosphate pyrophosphatase